jgi:hypothetical protein
VKKFLVAFALLISFLGAPTASAAQDNLVINEMQCDGNDWIEIYNPTSNSVDLTGWKLSDRDMTTAVTAKHIYSFQKGTSIAPKAFKTVKQTASPGGLPFGIGCTRQETIYLGYKIGYTWVTVDEIDPPAFLVGATYGRSVDGAGVWAPSAPTENRANDSYLPKLVGTGAISCKAMKKCTKTLSATRNAAFSLTSVKTGVTLSPQGTLTISARKVQTFTLAIDMTNEYGSTKKTISIKISK